MSGVKKGFKLIALVAAVLVLVATLCSCDMIDEKRAKHGVWQDNGESFKLNGELYRRVTGTTYIDIAAKNGFNLTGKDIPLLFSDEYGDYANVDRENGVAIYNNRIYAAERNYDYVKETLFGGTPVCTSYGMRWRVTDRNGISTNRYFAVSDELRSAIDNRIKQIESNRKDILSNSPDKAKQYWVELTQCDERGMFSNGKKAIQVYKLNDEYYISFKGYISQMYLLDSNTQKLFDEYIDELKSAGVDFSWNKAILDFGGE